MWLNFPGTCFSWVWMSCRSTFHSHPCQLRTPPFSWLPILHVDSASFTSFWGFGENSPIQNRFVSCIDRVTCWQPDLGNWAVIRLILSFMKKNLAQHFKAWKKLNLPLKSNVPNFRSGKPWAHIGYLSSPSSLTSTEKERCAALLLAPKVWGVHVSFVLSSASSQRWENNTQIISWTSVETPHPVPWMASFCQSRRVQKGIPPSRHNSRENFFF